MRTPKIGDIVHYCSPHGQTLAAIITKINNKEEMSCYLFIYLQNYPCFTSTLAEYSEKLKKECWSWPEEEKKCEHEYDLDRSGERLTLNLKCRKCGDVSICPIKNIHAYNKAEELIEKIWSLLIKILADKPVHGHEWGTSNNLIYKWIEEYKGEK